MYMMKFLIKFYVRKELLNLKGSKLTCWFSQTQSILFTNMFWHTNFTKNGFCTDRQILTSPIVHLIVSVVPIAIF